MALHDIDAPIIKKIDYNLVVIESIQPEKLILDYPTVYIIKDRDPSDKHNYTVYVGETADIIRRTKQHLKDDIKNGRDDFQKLSESITFEMYIIGHKFFNKSLTLDIENKFLHYLSSIDKISKVNNRRGNPQKDYYTSEAMESIFSKVWRKLNKENSNLFPAESVIRDSALFKASPFHKLTNEQISAKDMIITHIISILGQNLEGQLLLVEGEAGSGKTVLMSNLLYDLFYSDDLPINKEKLSIHLLVNHEQQLVVYKQLAKKLGFKNYNYSDVINKPTSFINSQAKRARRQISLL